MQFASGLPLWDPDGWFPICSLQVCLRMLNVNSHGGTCHTMYQVEPACPSLVSQTSLDGHGHQLTLMLNTYTWIDLCVHEDFD